MRVLEDVITLRLVLRIQLLVLSGAVGCRYWHCQPLLHVTEATTASICCIDVGYLGILNIDRSLASRDVMDDTADRDWE